MLDSIPRISMVRAIIGIIMLAIFIPALYTFNGDSWSDGLNSIWLRGLALLVFGWWVGGFFLPKSGGSSFFAGGEEVVAGTW